MEIISVNISKCKSILVNSLNVKSGVCLVLESEKKFFKYVQIMIF